MGLVGQLVLVVDPFEHRLLPAGTAARGPPRAAHVPHVDHAELDERVDAEGQVGRRPSWGR